MDETVDILCVIDAETLADLVGSGKISKGSLNSPTSLGAWGSSDLYIYMITEGSFVVNNQAKSELTIKTSVGDNVRWHITCPSNRQSCMLYQLQTGSTLLGPMELLHMTETEYINDTATTAKKVTYQESAWQTTVLGTGSVQYSWNFQLIDNKTGNVLGYFCWDPFINIAEN
jgi:nematocidal protein AidA